MRYAQADVKSNSAPSNAELSQMILRNVYYISLGSMSYCSNCGERIVEQQTYCRSCGAEVGIRPTAGVTMPRRIIIAGLFNTLAGALIWLIAGFLGSEPVAFGGAIYAFVSVVAMMIGAVIADSLRRNRPVTATHSDSQPVLEKADTTNQLPPIPAEEHFSASVTEHTTTKLHSR